MKRIWREKSIALLKLRRFRRAYVRGMHGRERERGRGGGNATMYYSHLEGGRKEKKDASIRENVTLAATGIDDFYLAHATR